MILYNIILTLTINIKIVLIVVYIIRTYLIIISLHAKNNSQLY